MLGTGRPRLGGASGGESPAGTGEERAESGKAALPRSRLPTPQCAPRWCEGRDGGVAVGAPQPGGGGATAVRNNINTAHRLRG